MNIQHDLWGKILRFSQYIYPGLTSQTVLSEPIDKILPPEILEKILEFFDGQDLELLKTTSTSFYKIITSSKILQEFILWSKYYLPVIETMIEKIVSIATILRDVYGYNSIKDVKEKIIVWADPRRINETRKEMIILRNFCDQPEQIDGGGRYFYFLQFQYFSLMDITLSFQSSFIFEFLQMKEFFLVLCDDLEEDVFCKRGSWIKDTVKKIIKSLPETKLKMLTNIIAIFGCIGLDQGSFVGPRRTKNSYECIDGSHRSKYCTTEEVKKIKKQFKKMCNCERYVKAQLFKFG